jgi:CBS domain containing-hemolysin-like protein
MAKSDKRKSYWWIKVFFITLLLSVGFSFVSETVTGGAHLAVAIVLLIIFIALNILFDLIGIAVASCAPEPFHSMAARKIKGAKSSLRILNRAEQVSNICNDVVGDVCGIMSGALGGAIVLEIVSAYGFDGAAAAWAIGLSAVVAAVTVSGKAFFKRVALSRSHSIVAFLGRLLNVFKKEK